MSDQADEGKKKDEGKSLPPGPGKIAGYGLAAGLSIWAVLYGFANGAEAIGFVHNHYPTVIMGIVTTLFLIGAVAASFANKKKDGGH